MNKWSIFGISLFGVSAALAYAHFEQGSLWWLGVGSTMGISLFAVLSSFQKTEIPEIKSEPQGEVASLQTQLKTAQSNLEKEIAEQSRLSDAFRKKLHEAHEKCESYKKLVDVHQFEIDKLRQENKMMSEESLVKTRRITELELYLEDPKALPNGDKELEFLYNQLKKQFEEKSRLLDHTRVELFQVENKLLTLQKEHEEKNCELSTNELSLAQQLAQVEEEKQKLESELTAVQALVTELSAKKKRAPKIASATEPNRHKKAVKEY